MLGSGSDNRIPKLDTSLITRKTKPPLKIGLTGGIGSGKTTVSNLFRERGIPIIDADVIAHEIVQPNQPTYQEIVNLFGPEVLSSDSRNNHQLDRRKLREIVFKAPEKLLQLEKITHPSIIASMNKQVEQIHTDYCILSIPLLFEKNLEASVDRILVVDIPAEIQKQRTAARDGVSQEQIQAIMDRQTSRETRLKMAEDVITNNGSIEDLQEQVNTLHRQYMEIAA